MRFRTRPCPPLLCLTPPLCCLVPLPAEYLEQFLEKQSKLGDPFPFELFAGRKLDGSRALLPHSPPILAKRPRPHVLLPPVNVRVTVDEEVTVVCGPVVGRVGVDGAIILLEVDKTAVGACSCFCRCSFHFATLSILLFDLLLQ